MSGSKKKSNKKQKQKTKSIYIVHPNVDEVVDYVKTHICRSLAKCGYNSITLSGGSDDDYEAFVVANIRAIDACSFILLYVPNGYLTPDCAVVVFQAVLTSDKPVLVVDDSTHVDPFLQFIVDKSGGEMFKTLGEVCDYLQDTQPLDEEYI